LKRIRPGVGLARGAFDMSDENPVGSIPRPASIELLLTS
jgi:hypothetical protein